MEKLTQINRLVDCCQLIKFLGKINKELSETKLEPQEVIKLIYCFLEKKNQLCKKCG